MVAMMDDAKAGPEIEPSTVGASLNWLSASISEALEAGTELEKRLDSILVQRTPADVPEEKEKQVSTKRRCALVVSLEAESARIAGLASELRSLSERLRL